ncbi:hypothetical protein [Terriglobus albidus]|uniref:hypothetical protein n=1 Tax=Terriglobus albidus TaxID=1592106 RepID=UPI0021E02C98|nr:hypothetical protein [Terriglobus albidus]
MRDFMSIRKTNYKLIVVVGIALFALPLYSAAQAGSASEQDKTRLLVQKVIAAMGGNQWRSVGAVTSTVSISLPDSSAALKEEWSDDWSTGTVSNRREQIDGSDKKAWIFTPERSETYGKTATPSISPPEYDLINIARSMPAVALLIGASRDSCVFSHEVRADESKQIAISQVCIARLYPNHRVEIKWIIDASSALPISVELPIRGMNGNVSLATVTFLEFKQADGLKYPVRAEITWSGTKFTKTISMTETKFYTALDKSKFLGR